jgi:hypothetical protein
MRSEGGEVDRVIQRSKRDSCEGKVVGVRTENVEVACDISSFSSKGTVI